MKISIIIATLNNIKTINQCIKSIYYQTYHDIEVVIVDGQSNDGTLDFINQNSKNIDYWESGPDDGIYDAWNKALVHTTGEWMCFLGADDYFWSPEVLHKIAPSLKTCIGKHQIAYGKIALVNEAGEVVEYLGRPWEKVKKDFSHYMAIPHVGMFHHRSIFKELGNFDKRFKIAGDYDLLLKVFKREDPLFISDIVVAGMRIGGIGTKPENAFLGLKEIAIAKKKNNLEIFSFIWFWMIIKAGIKIAFFRFAGAGTTRKFVNLYRLLSGRKAV
jgi:glycosyltransferase involved in cell wall biosynthesis